MSKLDAGEFSCHFGGGGGPAGTQPTFTLAMRPPVALPKLPPKGPTPAVYALP
jgi:hypothetical protein